MTHPRVRPVRVTYFDPKLEVEVRRTVGFQAMLGDHSIAPARSTYDEARADLRENKTCAKR